MILFELEHNGLWWDPVFYIFSISYQDFYFSSQPPLEQLYAINNERTKWKWKLHTSIENVLSFFKLPRKGISSLYVFLKGTEKLADTVSRANLCQHIWSKVIVGVGFFFSQFLDILLF